VETEIVAKILHKAIHSSMYWFVYLSYCLQFYFLELIVEKTFIVIT